MHVSRRRLGPVAVIAVAAMTLTACAGGADDPVDEPTADGGDTAVEDGAGEEATPEGIEDVCAAAEDEDTLEVWSDWSNPDGIFAAFAEAYPNIDYTNLTILGEDAVPRVITESAAGQPSVDVMYGNIGALAPAVDREIFDQDIDWESVGVLPELIRADQGNVVRVAQVAYGIGYNTDKYSEEDLPDTWEELIAPEWAGKKLMIDPRGRPFFFLATEWGQEETIDFVRRLIDETDPIQVQGTTAGFVALSSGDGEILLNGRTPEAAEQAALGAPVAIKLLDPVPLDGQYYGVVAGTESPNAARCFVAWSASEDGEAAHFEADFKANTLPEGAEGAETFTVEGEEELQLMLATTEGLTGIIAGGGS